MCGRLTLHHTTLEVAERFKAQEVLMEMPLRFNIAPMQPMSVVAYDARSHIRALQPMQWGLVPSWAKDPGIGNRLINARAETLTEKPSFRTAIKRRRCLIPSDGFYEWRRTAGAKVPHHIRLPQGELFAMAGLWEEWESPDGSPLRSCTIITVEPNAAMAELHNRMPALLAPDEEAQWLSPTLTLNDAVALLRPWKGMLDIYPVSRRVNAGTVDDPSLLEPEHEDVKGQRVLDYEGEA
jgi:putative SOS response-associated peptidase YedK